MAMDTADEDSEPRRGGGPFQFWREARAEARKVTWATRSEVTVSTIMVLMMTVAAALFFFFIDTIVGFVISFFLSLHL
ncbi:MAG: preprotein translocase subunit SecE [Terricaulis sp.]